MESKKAKIAVIGLGNLGRGVLDAAEIAPDVEIAGAVSSRAESLKRNYAFPVVKEVAELENVEIAILCGPTKQVTQLAPQYHEAGISTVDSFDMHAEHNWHHYQTLKKSALRHQVRALTSGGMDPGFCSMVRALFQIPTPRGISYVNYGPGTSLGHSVAVRAVKGVKNGISITIPKGFGLHRRDCFIETEKGADKEKIRKEILKDDYFSHDETYVYFVDYVENRYDVGHKVVIERNGVSGKTHNQHYTFQTTFTNNPSTGQLLIACARALSKQPPGIYTMIDMPIRDFLTPIKSEEQLFGEVI